MLRTLRHYQKFLLSFLITVLLAVSITPNTANSLGLSDFLRIAPSVIQVVQLSNISDNDEVQLGKQINRSIISEVQLSRSRAANDLVRSIGNELVPQSDRPNIPYTFQVVDNKDINAFATMGGFVYINTGTITAADNRAQLASVIAHEMGHISGRHSLEQLRQQAITQGILTLVGADRNRLINIGTDVALRLPNSREAEFDADRRGLSNITRSQYAPQAMPEFMEKLARKSGSIPSFLSSHPAASERVVVLRQAIQTNNLQGRGGLDNADYQRRWRSL